MKISIVTNPITLTPVLIDPPYETHPLVTATEHVDAELKAFIQAVQDVLAAMWELRMDPKVLTNTGQWRDFSRPEK